MTMRTQKASGSSAKARSGNWRQSGLSIPTALIEPNVLFREGLNHILAQTRFHVVMRSDTIASLQAAPRARRTPGLVLLHTDDSVDATISDIAYLKATYASCRVVCSAQSYRSEDVIALLGAGANGVLLRTVSADTFVKSLELVMLGERVIPAATLSLGTLAVKAAPAQVEPAQSEPDRKPKILRAHRGYQLSERELAILKCLVLGEANKIIALKLDIAEATVKVHVKAILRKIHVQNRTQAAIWALNHLAETNPTDAIEHARNHANGAAGPQQIGLTKGADLPLQLC